MFTNLKQKKKKIMMIDSSKQCRNPMKTNIFDELSSNKWNPIPIIEFTTKKNGPPKNQLLNKNKSKEESEREPVGLSARDEEKSREVRRIRFKNPTFLSAPGVLFWKYFSRSTLQNRDLSLQLYKHQFCITRSQTQRVLLFLQQKKNVRFLNEKVEQWGILWAESGKKYIFSIALGWTKKMQIWGESFFYFIFYF